MEFQTFISKISQIKKTKLGGLKTQFEFAPKMRLQYTQEKISELHPKKAAVLCLLFPNEKNETCFLLTQRATYNGTHSAQISFPGGKMDKNDSNFQYTALRETFEEVGLNPNKITIIKQMTDAYIPPSNFLVSPFLGYCNDTPTFFPNEEVKEIISVPLKKLFNNQYVKQVKINTSYAKNLEVPCFQFDNYIVWGATAMMLNEIKKLLQF